MNICLKSNFYEFLARKMFMLFANEFLFLIFFNSSGREFHTITSSNVGNIFCNLWKSKEEKILQMKIALCYTYVSFLSCCCNDNLSGLLFISNIMLAVSRM